LCGRGGHDTEWMCRLVVEDSIRHHTELGTISEPTWCILHTSHFVESRDPDTTKAQRCSLSTGFKSWLLVKAKPTLRYQKLLTVWP
jgi:hypothetical protein